MKRQKASVLLFSLLIISVIIILTEQLIRGVMVGSGFTKAMVDREHAEMLALGGVNVAISQLTYDKKEKDKDQKTQADVTAESDEQSDKITSLQKFLFRLISNLNRWQDFELNSKVDGVSGSVKICISSEQGKININEAFDFKKQEFKKEFKFLLAKLEIPGKIPAGEFLNKISEYLKRRGKKLYDISELMNISGFERLDIFYDPPKIYKKGGAQSNTELALQDIFTIWTDDVKIDPLLLSDALCSILNLRRPRADDAKKYKERFRELAMAFKEDWGKDWDANWKYLQSIYDSKPKELSNIKDILVEKFNPRVYSVLSCGRVGQVEQRVLAIIKEIDKRMGSTKKSERNAKKDTSEKQPGDVREQQEKEKLQKVFKVIRVYWL